ncbi:MAG: LysM peptidoglycan-binding domain-containing protein [Nitrospirota bacterium]
MQVIQRKNFILKGFTLFFYILLLLPSLLTAQTIKYETSQEYKDYIVQKGDTLWDISNKELINPFFWPKVWKENPEIENPDRIYPYQKIRIPYSLLKEEMFEAMPKTEVEVKPETTPEVTPEVLPETKPEIEIAKEKPVEEIAKPEIVKPVKKEYLVDKNLLIASGYIADSIPCAGKIIDSPTNRTLLGKNDYAYIKTKSPAKAGDKFYIIRAVEKVAHPVYGNSIGYLIEILGVAEVVEEGDEPKIKITVSFDEIEIGSILDNFYEIESPLAPETPRMPDIDCFVVTTKQLRAITGMLDIVFIDKGTKDGLQSGDLLVSLLPDKHKITNGLLQIIYPRESTSTAIVRKSKNEITKGDSVTGLKQE